MDFKFPANAGLVSDRVQADAILRPEIKYTFYTYCDIKQMKLIVSLKQFCPHNHTFSVDKKNQLDATFCILYFSSNSCSTCFGQPCAHHQELTTA